MRYPRERKGIYYSQVQKRANGRKDPLLLHRLIDHISTGLDIFNRTLFPKIKIGGELTALVVTA